MGVSTGLTYKNVDISYQDNFNIDAFGRARVSNPETLFDSKNIFDDDGLAANVENQALLFDNAETSGSGTSTSLRINEAAQRITVANITAGTRVRQTKQRFNYQPGKSQLIFTTFNFIANDANITKRVGYFDENNGIYFESDGTDLKIVRRTFVSGSPANNEVTQSNWNIDPMDGTGPSLQTLDVTKTQILYIDFEWLGVGRVRVGFVINGLIYYVHEFLNANVLTTVYMSKPNLPVRYEISNDGSGAESNLDCICASVQSEGGQQDLGIVRYASNSTLVDANVAGTTYAVLGMKLKSEYIGAVVNIISVSLLETAGSKDLEWSLKFNPTVADTFTYADETNSSIQIARGATANEVTNGIDIAGGYFNSSQGNTAGSVSQGVSSALRLGSTIAGVADEIVLCVKPLTGVSNADVWGSITWRELT